MREGGLTSDPYKESEWALFEAMDTAYTDGTLCLHPTLISDIEAAYERVSRRDFGAHYDEYRALSDERSAIFEEVCSKRLPRWHYFCRIPYCQCDYPKSADELW